MKEADMIATASVYEDTVSPLVITTEELWSHIDHSLEQAKAGMGRDVDEVIDDLVQIYEKKDYDFWGNHNHNHHYNCYIYD